MSWARTLRSGDQVRIQIDADGDLVVSWLDGCPVGRVHINEADRVFELYDPDGNEIFPASIPVSDREAIETLAQAAREAGK